MPSFLQLFTLAALATLGTAQDQVLSFLSSHCPNAEMVRNGSITADTDDIKYTSHRCEIEPRGRRGLFDEPPLCYIFNSCEPPEITSVCGATCDISCNNNTGVLPPISQDCQTIVNAIEIFKGQQPDNFTVAANHLETLTFGTCSFFFENLGTTDIQYCWSSLSVQGVADGAACFPPNQPFFSEGLCVSPDGSWAVGASHS